MTNKKRMISSRDVAREANVSQATVSRVLNNPDSVKLEKRKKVLETIQRLNYHPNLIARSLVTNSTKTIALISGSILNNFFADAMVAIVNNANHKGYRTMISLDGDTNLLDTLNKVWGQNVDGILLSLIQMDDPLVEQIVNSDIPHMFFNRYPRKKGNYVAIDNRLAADLVTRHMIELGHRRIAYLSGETRYSTFYEREFGYRQVMEEHGLPIEKSYFQQVVSTDASTISTAVRNLMKRTPAPTAIVCSSDAIAVACMDSLIEMGIRIPGDVSLSGIDNIRLASHHAINLTTAGDEAFRLGEIAVQRLMEMIENPELRKQPCRIIVPPKLVVRSTTATI